MRILFLGDIVGSPGRDVIKKLVPSFREREKLDAVIANGENAASGSGVTVQTAEELFNSGIDVLTSGDHIWKKKEILEYLDRTDRLIRPANYPDGAPGLGATVVEIKNKGKFAVINLLGRVFMDAVDCPFLKAEKEIEKLQGETKIIIVDMHAEATSEKVALSWFLDGRVSAVIGTHTHVQTADEKILPKGTAYLTDAGMTGPFDSVIGRRKEPVIERFLTQLPTKFEVADNGLEMHGAIIDIDDKTGKAISIRRVQEKVSM